MTYSQFGEDEYFRENLWEAPKLVVDIGAGDGTTISNSRYLIEEMAWGGILADANKEKIDEARQLYIENVRVRTYHRIFNHKYTKARLDNNEEWTLRGLVEDINGMDTTTLSDFINSFADEPIGLLSVDLEGRDTAVIREYFSHRSINKPKYVIIEGNTDEDRKKQQRIIKAHGYDLVKTFGEINQLFRLK